ncbi:hypothetical protein [Sphingomonas radiodurans]|uniref:hypothetical protein n=1 Tax=Sphingomonas radiodurans TaxID=2890321 RepID=UPI001E382131|nr:hypothetical protein [Sphingomonas radiodurans]WBH17703.1 hypothetical protein LLW23_06265 [Sphingomonas radiodurans]
MRTVRIMVSAALLPLLAGGCIRTTASVVTAPFKVAGQAADWATTSQDEADRNFGCEMRKKEAREGRERRDWQKRCRKDPENCGAYDGYVAGRDN